MNNKEMGRREFIVEAARKIVGGALTAKRLNQTIEAGALLLAGVKLIDARPAYAEPAFPSWTYSKPGMPEGDNTVEGMIPLNLSTDQGNTIEVIGGPFGYQDPKGVLFTPKGQAEGEDRATVFIVDGGAANIETKAWKKGNWVGVTPNPNGQARLTEANQNHLLLDACKSLRDPKLGNGIEGNGVKDDIDFAIVDGQSGNIMKMGINKPDGVIEVKYQSDIQAAQPIQPVAEVAAAPQGAERSYEILPGQEVIVKRGSIIRGEFMYRDPNTGQLVIRYDSDPETGLVSILDQDLAVVTNYSVGVVENPAGDVLKRAEGFAAEVTANGCVDGCSRGTFIAHVPNGPFQKP